MRLWLAWVVVVGGGCDQDFAGGEDADADDGNETASLYRSVGGYGLDPENGVAVDGPLVYSPGDPGFGEVVHLGATERGVIADRTEWEGGPVLGSRGADEIAKATTVVPDEPVTDHGAETGSWLVVGGRVVLAAGPEVDAGWVARAPSDVEREAEAGDTFVARLPVELERLPHALGRVVGAEVRVFDQEREVCIARVAGIELEARLVHEPLGGWLPTYSERELLARGLRSVVATLEPLAGANDACNRGVVAVGVRAPSPSLYRSIEVTPSARRKAINATCGLEAWQRRAAGEGEIDTRPWSAACRALTMKAEVRGFETRLGLRFWVVSAAGLHAGFSEQRAGLEDCWVFTSKAPAAGLIDVHGDGHPELVLGPSARAPASLSGARFGGDLTEPTFLEDWTPVPPERLGVGGYTVPDYSVFEER